MITGKVIGSIYSTINHAFYDQKKLLMVETFDAAGKLSGDYLIAVDTVSAGPGDPVLVVDEGNGARQILDSADGPVRSVIVGILDHVDRN